MTNETATDNVSMQDIASRVEGALFEGTDDNAELDTAQDDVAQDDEAILPESDDTESDDDQGSDDLADIANEEDLSLASYLGLDDEKLTVKDDGSVVFNAIIDGEAKEVPLSDLATSYQLQGHVNNKSIALQDERKEFETQRDTVATELSSRLDKVAQMTKMVEEQLVGDFNNIDWDRLRIENPSEWSALRQEYAEKAQKMQHMQSQISSQQKELNDNQQGAMKQQQQAYLQDQVSKMVVANPTWADQTIMQAETGKLKEFLGSTYGFSSEDFDYVTDHRLIGLIQDAQAYRSGKKTAEVKIAKKVPRFQKPGAAKGNAKSLAKARSVKANKGALKSTGKLQDAANLLLDRM